MAADWIEDLMWDEPDMTMLAKTTLKMSALAAAVGLLASCGGGDYSAEEDTSPRSGPLNEYSEKDETILGEGGVSLNRILSGDVLGSTPGEGEGIPVNKFLWQATLDTLQFLPLASTDPFTGVIATDWGASPSQPGERFKVTAYMVRPALAASSLKVAVYREVRSEAGVWVPAAVDPTTPRKIEDAILTRARQIRIADVEGKTTG